MFLLYPAIFIFIYLLFRLILPSKMLWKTKALLSILLLVASQQLVFDYYFFERINSPKLASTLLSVQGGVFFTLILLVVMTIVKDIFLFLRMVFHFFTTKKSERLNQLGSDTIRNSFEESDGKSPFLPAFSQERRTFLFLATAAIPAVYSVKAAVTVPRIKKMNFSPSNLPIGLDGLRIIQISDLHISPLFTEDWVMEVVKKVNSQNPDLILFTGDMVDGSPSQRKANIKPLAQLKARYGVFGCVGNHEYYSNFVGWIKTFPRLGITLLQNSHQHLRINGTSLVIAGVTDIAAKNMSFPMPNPRAALSGIPKDAFCIMLDHRPGNAAANALAGSHLQLSGHTHGGQILGMDRIVKQLNNGFVHGWYQSNGMPMYVCSGAGLWDGFPVRLGVPSELPCITLKHS